jgi:anaerobic magnesium-protoporphyrin IX monomethyl ester cyclase
MGTRRAGKDQLKTLLVETPLALRPTGVYPRNPPIYALYAAATLKRDGAEVQLLDAFQEDLSIDDTVARVVGSGARLVLLVPFDYVRETAPEVTREIARRLAVRAPQCTVGLAGNASEKYMRSHMEACPSIAFAAVGEYELTLAGVVKNGLNRLGRVPGLLLRSGNGIESTGPAAVILDADRLALPAWELVDFDRYIYMPHRFGRTPVYPLLASRGCPYGCPLCIEGMYARITRYRLRSVRSVMQEVRLAIQRYGARELQFTDATFGLNREWTISLCDALARLDPPVTWTVLSRADVLTPELLERMRHAGCWNILYGFESANQHALDNMGKGLRVEQTVQARRQAREAGIEVTASFTLGLPGESREDILRTIDFAIEQDPEYAQFFILKYLNDDNAMDRWGWVTEEWDNSPYDFRGPIFVPDGIDGVRELKQLQRLAYRRFYLRPRYLAAQLSRAISSGQLRRNGSGLKTLVELTT